MNSINSQRKRIRLATEFSNRISVVHFDCGFAFARRETSVIYVAHTQTDGYISSLQAPAFLSK
jgi:hypothetical protein